MNIYVVTTIACLLTFVKEGLGLHCYQCDSRNHPDCKEYFDWEHENTITIRSEECKVDASEYCIKTTGVWGGVVGTTRFCSSRDMGNQCQYIRYPDHDRVYRACIYTCKGDGCNGASGVQISAWSVTLSVILATVLTLYGGGSYRHLIR